MYNNRDTYEHNTPRASAVFLCLRRPDQDPTEPYATVTIQIVPVRTKPDPGQPPPARPNYQTVPIQTVPIQTVPIQTVPSQTVPGRTQPERRPTRNGTGTELCISYYHVMFIVPTSISRRVSCWTALLKINSFPSNSRRARSSSSTKPSPDLGGCSLFRPTRSGTQPKRTEPYPSDRIRPDKTRPNPIGADPARPNPTGPDTTRQRPTRCTLPLHPASRAK